MNKYAVQIEHFHRGFFKNTSRVKLHIVEANSVEEAIDIGNEKIKSIRRALKQKMLDWCSEYDPTAFYEQDARPDEDFGGEIRIINIQKI